MDTEVKYRGEDIQLHISPYKIERKCNVSPQENKDSMYHLVDIENEIDGIEDSLAQSIEHLEQIMYEEIGNLPAESVKAAIKAKQNVGKRKFDNLSEEQKSLFSEETLKYIDDCHEISNRINELKKQKADIFRSNQLESAEAIRDSLRNDRNYFNGLAMSVYNDELYKNILELKSNHEVKLNKKTRNTLYSLRNYYNRMSKKPSPFSTFVSTELSFIDEKNEAIDNTSEQFHPKVYLNELVLKSLENLLLQDNSFFSKFYVKINPTLQVNSDYYEFLSVDVHNAKMYYSENVLRIARNQKIDGFIKLLENGENLPIAQVISEMRKVSAEYKDDIDVIKDIIVLDKIGIIFKNFNIYHQDYDMMDRIIALLEERPEENYVKIKNALVDIKTSIQIINDTVENIELKRGLQGKIYEDIKIIFEDYPAEVFDFGYIKKNVLYENNTLPKIKTEVSIDEDIQKSFYWAEKLYRIFDNNYVQRIMFRNIFLRNFDVKDKVPVLKFYEIVSNEYKNSLEELLKNDKDIKQIEKLQDGFLALLEKKRRESAEIINITQEDIEEIYKDAPKIMDDKISYGVYYQCDNENYVINNISPGIGRHVIRYVSDLPKDEAEKFIERYKQHVRSLESDKIIFTDIGTSLGISINKHYEVLGKAFGYPKSMYENEVQTSSLGVIYDFETESVKLVDEDGIVYDSTPIGFLFPRISPGFYSFLSTFSNSRGASMSFWDRFYDEVEKDKNDVVRYPRIVVNNRVTINRETWKIRGDMYDNLEDTEDGYLALMSELFYKYSLPKKFFAKKSSDINAIKSIGESTADWEKIITNNKLRKPQYFDMNNYLDYGILTSFVNTYRDLPMTIQEVLPVGDEPVEHLIEINEIK